MHWISVQAQPRRRDQRQTWSRVEVSVCSFASGFEATPSATSSIHVQTITDHFSGLSNYIPLIKEHDVMPLNSVSEHDVMSLTRVSEHDVMPLIF